MSTLKTSVAAAAARYSAEYMHQLPAAARRNAVLSRAAGQPMVESTDALQYTIAAVPDDAFWGSNSGPGHAEKAAHVALTMHALHQRSQRSTAAHLADTPFGSAIARLHDESALSLGIQRRFDDLCSAEDLEELMPAMHSLISRLNGTGIGLNYGELAEDLAAFQKPAAIDRIRMKWGRDFYRARSYEAA